MLSAHQDHTNLTGFHPFGYVVPAFPFALKRATGVGGSVFIDRTAPGRAPTAGLSGPEPMTPGLAREPTFATASAARAAS